MGEISVPERLVRRRVQGRRRAYAAAWGEREAFPLLVVAVCGIELLRYLRLELHQDGWLALLAGRAVADHGLPHHDTLTIWAHGVQWVDQQWLGQLAFYGLFVAGGIKLVMLVNALLVTGAFGGAVAAARLRGATPVRAAAVAALCFPVVAIVWQFRTQSLAYPLFVAVLWLLVRDALSPSRRVFLVLPLLVLWANVHGSVAFGALLVSLRGLTVAGSALRARRPGRTWLPRSGLLVVSPWLCLLATPYGLSVVDYYHRTLLNPTFAQYVSEWRPSTPGAATVPFYILAFAALWLLGKSRGTTLFERLVLLVTVGAGLAAARNIIWFGLVALVVLPSALEEIWPARARESRHPRLNVTIASAALVGALALTVSVATRPLSWLATDWSPAAASAVASEAASHPRAAIFATPRYADWLLFTRPQLAGRIAVDARLELLTDRQLRRLFEVEYVVSDRWRATAAPYRLFVVDPSKEKDLQQALLDERGVRPLYRDGHTTVLVRRS